MALHWNARWLLFIAALAMFFSCVFDAVAQEGVQRLGVGLLHIDPHSSSGPLTLVEVNGVSTNQPQVGSGVEVTSANTMSILYEYAWTGHISTELVLGLPPKHRLRGTGTLEGVGVIGEGRQYSPTLLLRYHFGASDMLVRPFVGAGINYTWYGQSKVTNEAFLQSAYGPDARTHVTLSRSWNAAATAGVEVRITDRCNLAISAGYAPLSTTITVAADDTAIGLPFKVTTRVHNRTVGAGVALTYGF